MKKGGKVRRIGLALERESIFARKVLEGVAETVAEAGRAGMALDVRFLHDRLVRDASETETFDAFIAQIQDDAMAQTLTATGRPVVDVLFRSPHAGAVVVNADNAAIARTAVEHLVDRKFTKFAFCGRNGVAYSDQRRDAFVALLAERGFECDVYRLPRSVERSVFMGRVRRFGENIDEPPDEKHLESWVKGLPKGVAVFCCQDMRAYQVVRACRKAGLRVPEDIAVLGVDDDPVFCRFTDPRLSSIDPNAEEVGRESVRAVCEMMSGARRMKRAIHRFVQPKGLSIRESTDVYRVDHPWLGRALEFIHADPSAGITAADVFAHVGLSHTVVDRFFRARLGTSVQKEIMKSRLDRAADLLRRTQMPVREVAQSSGFSSFPYFCSSFCERFGMTATVYRECCIKRN